MLVRCSADVLSAGCIMLSSATAVLRGGRLGADGTETFSVDCATRKRESYSRGQFGLYVAGVNSMKDSSAVGESIASGCLLGDPFAELVWLDSFGLCLLTDRASGVFSSRVDPRVLLESGA